ncbi:hypothetical protein HK101_003478 [Irineochytrium annulatum]|nr:hypothetical protein HK101_003478 [Irineochytrium annulatum]
MAEDAAPTAVPADASLGAAAIASTAPVPSEAPAVLENTPSATTLVSNVVPGSGGDKKNDATAADFISTGAQEPPVYVVTENADPEAGKEDGEGEAEFVKYSMAVLVPLFVGLISAHFLAALDATIVSTALNKIGEDFNAMPQISWIATAYVLTFNSFQPLVGKFAQIFGHKSVTLFGILVFMAGSAGNGAAVNINMLIAFRALQGIGGAALISMVLISISDMFPLKDRPKYLTILWINFGVSTIIGPLLGGAFTDHLSWRWNFYINLPVGVVAFPLVYFFLNIPFKRQSFREQVGRIDFLGTVLLLVTVILILIPTSLGGVTIPWNSPTIIVCFVLCFIFLIALIYTEVYIAKEPIIPPHLFKIRSVVAVFVTNFFQGMCFFAFVFYGPLYFQTVKAFTATASGLQLLPLLLGLVIFSIVGTVLLGLVKSYPPFVILGSLLITGGSFWFSTLDQNSSVGIEIGALLFVGMGLGFSLQMLILSAQGAVEQKDTGIVSSLAGFFQSIGGGIGLAILSAILNARLTEGAMQGMDPVSMYVYGLQGVFRYATPFGAIAFIASCFIDWKTRVLTPEEMKNNAPAH